MQVNAHIKYQPDDWRVVEHLDTTQLDAIESGEGEHLYVYLRKTNLNTLDVVDLLAGQFNVPRIAIGYAGRKDKRAVTDQWFSIHTPMQLSVDQLATDGKNASVAILKVGRSTKKLRVGELLANEFHIRLRGLAAVRSGSAVLGDDLRDNQCDLQRALSQPFANEFGPQRFASDNVDAAIDWVLNRRARQVSQRQRGWHLSVLRSFLFNKVVCARRQRGDIFRAIQGDHCIDGVPTAPLWGRGRSKTAGLALEVEGAALAELADVCEAIEYAGVNQARRKLYCLPDALQVLPSVEPGILDVKFRLPPGTYATTLLAHTFTLIDDANAAL